MRQLCLYVHSYMRQDTSRCADQARTCSGQPHSRALSIQSGPHRSGVGDRRYSQDHPMKKLIPVVVIALAALAAYFYLRPPAADPTRIRLSGNLEVIEINMAFKTPGRVVELHAKEGDAVTQGQVLARLETQSLELQKTRDEAGVTAAQSALAQLRIDTDRTRESWEREMSMRRAEIAQAEAQVRDLQAGSRAQEVAQAQAALDDVRAQLDQARADGDRAQRLFANEDISRAAYDQAQTRVTSLSAAVRSAEQRLALVKEGPRGESIELARAQLTRARAATQVTEANRRELDRKVQEQTLRTAEIERARAQAGLAATQLEDSAMRAPSAGIVLSRPVEPGEVVGAGATVLTIGDLGRPTLRAYVTETQLGRVKLGQKVKLTTDSLPGRTFDGAITFIASEAEFTPKQIQTPEERVKLVYRIKIEVPNQDGALKNNMPMDAEIATQ
ncbi:MAG: HlyD family efflux transporter periplasmic adaptor subunit [Acidobacteria bacterium]|nr:HlyD family efflux transporter periplasmic adaptor subunit [Acidobacteriota bacterium]